MKRKGNRGRKIACTVIGLLTISCMGFVYWLPSFVMTGKRQTIEEAFRWQGEHYDTSFYEKLPKNKYSIQGFEDYELHVEFLENPVKTTNYIILSHGYTDNRMGSLKYVSMYLDLGFNCILYDLRGHGENKPDFTTYGVREAKDLQLLIEDTKTRYSDLSALGLHGESLGAATSLTCLQYKPKVDFVVANCGFSDIENVLRQGYRNANLPTFLVDLADFAGKLRYGYSLKSMRPVDKLGENAVPILFIHGERDELISPRNSEDMHKRTGGYSELHLIPDAGHAVSVLSAPKEYREYVLGFLGKCMEKRNGNE